MVILDTKLHISDWLPRCCSVISLNCKVPGSLKWGKGTEL